MRDAKGDVYKEQKHPMSIYESKIQEYGALCPTYALDLADISEPKSRSMEAETLAWLNSESSSMEP